MQYYITIPEDADVDGRVIRFNDDTVVGLEMTNDEGHTVDQQTIDVKDFLKTSNKFEYDDTVEYPDSFESLSEELKDKMFDIALQYQSEWSEDSDPEVRSWADDDVEAIAKMLYEDADNGTRNDWFTNF